MRDWSGTRYWLVGASEGLGRALAHRMSRAGVELTLTARSRDRLEELAAELPGRTRVAPADITDMDACREAYRTAGEIDGLVFAAGLYWPQPAQAWDPGQVEAMCDVNFTGCARVVGCAIGDMVARDRGHVVLTGSLSGFRGLPGAIGYGASKAGVMSLAQSMRADLRRTGVQVQLVNPGFIRTRLTDKNDFAMPFIMEPDEAARIMFEHMGTDRFTRNFPEGFSWLFRADRIFPDWLHHAIFARG